MALCGFTDGPFREAARGLRGSNDIIRAAGRGNVGAARHLLRTVPGAAAATNALGETALHRVAILGRAELCRVLLAAGAPLEARTVGGLSAEMVLTCRRQVENLRRF